MTRWISLTVAALLTMSLVSPVWARTVRIETTVPLADHSEEALTLAITQAVEAGARGAAAMGMQWIRVDAARVVSDSLVVRMTASDDGPDEDTHDVGPKGLTTL